MTGANLHYPLRVEDAHHHVGRAGIEAHHRDHGPDEVSPALELASRLDLGVTGSSDDHGSG